MEISNTIIKTSTPLLILALVMMVQTANAQSAAPPITDGVESPLVSQEQIEFYTQEWEGERDRYGRPFVPDNYLERLEHVSLEEAWGTVRGAGYNNKFEGDWEIMHPGQAMTGRALTAVYMPAIPELEERMNEFGQAQGLQGSMNQWPIYMLQQGDVYVADGFGKIKDGTLIGDNLGQAIFTNSGNGPILYGSARDLDGLLQVDGFNAWVKAWHPSFIQEMSLVSINGPTRIGEASVLPGDIVLATRGGVLFIPPHLAEQVILSSEVTRLVDTFRIESIREGAFTLEQSYGTQWTDEMNESFYDWVEENSTTLHSDLGVGEETLQRIVDTRTRNWRQWIN